MYSRGRLVDRAEDFDALMGDIAEYIESGEDAHLALDDHHVSDPDERRTLEKTIAAMQRLHNEGRDHIWAYYTRNLVRPVALSHSKVDVIVGNPPWLSYRNTARTLRAELGAAKQAHVRHLGGRYTRESSRCIQPVLCPQRRSVISGTVA